MAKRQPPIDRSAPAAADLPTAVGERVPVRAVSRALDLLGLLCDTQARSLSELARASRLPVSTALRLLNTLEAAGFAQRDSVSGGYAAGRRLLQAGLSALRRTSLYDLSESALQRLSSASGETANLAIQVDEQHATYLRVVVSPRSVHYAAWVGRTLPMARTAVGRALSGRAEASGYVVKRNTLERDVTAVAAPVLGADGRIAAALSITGPSFRISDEDARRFGRLLLAEASALSGALGAT